MAGRQRSLFFRRFATDISHAFLILDFLFLFLFFGVVVNVGFG